MDGGEKDMKRKERRWDKNWNRWKKKKIPWDEKS